MPNVPSPEGATIQSGTLFTDTDGNPVHAHGAGIVVQGSTYYMVGTSEKLTGSWLSEGVNMYSSQDLQHWKFEGMVFKNTSITTPARTAPSPVPNAVKNVKIRPCIAPLVFSGATRATGETPRILQQRDRVFCRKNL